MRKSAGFAIFAFLSIFAFLLILGCQSIPLPSNNTSANGTSNTTGPNPDDGTFLPNITDYGWEYNDSFDNTSSNWTSDGDGGFVFIEKNRTWLNKSRDDSISSSIYAVPNQPYKDLEIYFFDIGYGESILIKKGEFDMLVDAGPQTSYQKLKPKLLSLEIDKIEVLVATRSRPEYIGAMPSVIEDFDAEDLWNNNVSGTIPEYSAMMSAAEQKKLVIKHPQAGDVLEISGLEIIVLNPPKQRFRNNPDDTDSIVLKVKYDDFCAILMSDAQTSTEYQIMGTFADIKCQVLHVGRNGDGLATTQSTLLHRITPKVAIISVGNNTEKNPKPTTLTQLKLLNIDTYRTDQDGTLKLVSDGSKTNYKIFTKQ